MVKILCASCGAENEYTLRTGRPRVNVTFQNVLKACQSSKNVVSAAEKIGCTPGTVYNRLREGNVDVKTLFKK